MTAQITAMAAPTTNTNLSSEKIVPMIQPRIISATITPTTASTMLGRIRGGRSTSMRPR